ncbi:MAG: GAF domain-containing protein [Dehalococcoidia bacterium]|nr:GAF domain-containing protein [Dehalococcoidia bacterium]
MAEDKKKGDIMTIAHDRSLGDLSTSSSRTQSDLIQLLAGQLQIANIALQDLDLEAALGQILQTICALLRSPAGLLLLYSADNEPAPDGRRNLRDVDRVAVAATMEKLVSRCSHAILFWRGYVSDVLHPSGSLTLAALLEELGEDQRFLAAPLASESRVVGQALVALPETEKGHPFFGQNFAALIDEAAKAIFRALAMQEARQQRREAQALYQTVHEISAYLDLDKVLKAIVRRAKDLFGADIGVLVVTEGEASQTYRRTEEGFTTQTGSRHPIDGGLVGLVTQLREPAYTSDYLTDSRFRHTERLDDDVVREGIRSALDVPLILADEVIGVLCVANRRPTNFTPDNIRLLTSLGNSAAVAIEKARLYGKEKETVAKLEELNALIAAQEEMHRKVMHLQHELARLILDGKGVEAIARAIADLINNPVIVDDHLFKLVTRAVPSSFAGPETEIDWQTSLHEALQDERLSQEKDGLIERLQIIRLPPLPEFGLKASRIVAPIVVGRKVLGYVTIVEKQGPVGELEFMILEQATTVFALEMAKQQAIMEVEHRLRRGFIDEVLSGKYESQQSVIKKALHFGYDLARSHHLIVLMFDEIGMRRDEVGMRRDEVDAGQTASSLERNVYDILAAELAKRASGAVVVDRDQYLLVLAQAAIGSADSPALLANRLVEVVNRRVQGFTISAGVGRVCHQVADYARSWHEALECRPS